MPFYSNKSKAKLKTCHNLLIIIFNKVIEKYDNTIDAGTRSDSDQNKLFKEGKTKVKGGKSLHNYFPSLAVDAYPYPLPDSWGEINIKNHKSLLFQIKERAKFYHFGGYVKGVADSLGIPLRCGCDWDNDNQFNDQSFDDLVHFELVKKWLDENKEKVNEIIEENKRYLF